MFVCKIYNGGLTLMNRELNSNRHSVYSLKYHLVLITKYRHHCTPGILKELERFILDYLPTKIVLFRIWRRRRIPCAYSV